MEDSLDEIAQGKKSYEDIVRSVDQGLRQELAGFRQKHSFPCPDCGQPLAHKMKKGQGGFDFWGCTGYPECRYSAENDQGKPGAKKKAAARPSEFKCSCGKALIRRKGVSKAGKDYDFYGCSGFRDGCKNSWQVKENGSPDFEGAKG